MAVSKNQMVILTWWHDDPLEVGDSGQPYVFLEKSLRRKKGHLFWDNWIKSFETSGSCRFHLSQSAVSMDCGASHWGISKAVWNCQWSSLMRSVIEPIKVWKSQLQTNNRTSPQDAFLYFNHLYIIIDVTANVGNIKFQLPNCENNWNWWKQSSEINFILLSPGEPVAQWNQEFVTPACSLRYNQDLGEQSQRKLEDQQKAADQAVKGETDWEGIVKT